MARNYDMIHYIQNRMSGMDEKLTNAVVRMFNKLDSRHCYASALSTSVTLLLAMKFLKLDPKLILGTVQYQGLSYPHAWLELNEKVFDLATYEDIQHHPVLKDRELKLIIPQINISYDDASDEICYYPFQFGETWSMASMKRLVGRTLDEYIEEAPMFDIMADVCYILEEPEVPENTDFLKAIAQSVVIRDADDV